MLKCEKIFYRMMRNLFIVAVNTVLRSLLDIQIPKYDRRISQQEDSQYWYQISYASKFYDYTKELQIAVFACLVP